MWDQPESLLYSVLGFASAWDNNTPGKSSLASFAVSWKLILLYWSIGRDILVRQDKEGWGTKVIKRLAKDLGVEFPRIEGFSPRNPKVHAELSRGVVGL